MINHLTDDKLEKELIPFLSGQPVSRINAIVDKLNSCTCTAEFINWYSTKHEYQIICDIMLSTVKICKGVQDDRKWNEITSMGN